MDTRSDERRTHRAGASMLLMASLLVLTMVAVTACAETTDAAGGGSSTPIATGTPYAPSPTKVTHSPKPSPTVTPTPAPDPNALADGVYPTYITDVDVTASAITVDVVQLFRGEDAVRAARQDGVSWQDSKYLDIYLRNENPLLRTLPVADGASIVFVGGCESPSTHVGLVKLSKTIAKDTGGYYYDVEMRDGTVVSIDQQYAVTGC
jgi:hypothetical protein